MITLYFYNREICEEPIMKSLNHYELPPFWTVFTPEKFPFAISQLAHRPTSVKTNSILNSFYKRENFIDDEPITKPIHPLWTNSVLDRLSFTKPIFVFVTVIVMWLVFTSVSIHSSVKKPLKTFPISNCLNFSTWKSGTYRFFRKANSLNNYAIIL